MKKVIIVWIMVVVVFQSCTDELYEVESVVSSAEVVVDELKINLDKSDIPQNAFSAFFLENEEEKVLIWNKEVSKIDVYAENQNGATNRLSGYWEGDFEFKKGSYDFLINSDLNLKIILDDLVLFDGISNGRVRHVKFDQSLNEIIRLKVFYNMDSQMKLQQIINYYNGIKGSIEERVSNIYPAQNSIIESGPFPTDYSTLVDWNYLGHN